VAADLAFSLLINIGGQLVLYPAVAPAERVTLLAVLVLGSACVRRFVVRQCFETCVPAGMGQPHWQSVLDSGVDTVLGFMIAVALHMLI
jgi:hypothetical protein